VIIIKEFGGNYADQTRRRHLRGDSELGIASRHDSKEDALDLEFEDTRMAFFA